MIIELVQKIRNGQFSRNKNFDLLERSNVYSLYKRARLLVSLLDEVQGGMRSKKNRIWIEKDGEWIAVHFENPILKYHRMVLLTPLELEALRQYHGFLPDFSPRND